MRMRSKGRYLYAINRDPIVWNANPNMLLPGEPIYCVSWTIGQHRLVASKIVKKGEVQA